MRRLFSFLGSFMAGQWKQFTPTGQLLYAMFIVAVLVDAGIAYQYGISMSGMHAAGFALVAVAFAVLPDIAAREVDRKAYGSAVIIALVLLPLGVTSYQSHIGYGAGVRLGDMQATQVQLTKVGDVRESLTSERESIAMWRKQLASLQERNAEHLKKNNGWLVTADPIAMQSQLDAMDQKIANEAKRVRCGPKCEELKVQRGQLAAMIAGIKEENDLTSRIEATQRTLDAKTQVAIDTKPKASVIVNQNDALGQLWHLATGQTVEATTVNLAATGNASLAFLALAPILGFAAGRNRWRRYMLGTHEDDTEDHMDPPPSAKAPVTPMPASYVGPIGIPSEPIHVHTVERDTRLDRWKASVADDVRAMLGAPQQLRTA